MLRKARTTAREWVLAFIGRIPMGFTEAAVLIVAGGGAILADRTFPPPADDPLWTWAIWWLVGIIGGILLLRGLVALVVMGGAAAARFMSPFVDALPFRFQTPIAWKSKPDPIALPLGALDYELAAKKAAERTVRGLTRLTNATEGATKLIEKYTPQFERHLNASTEKRKAISQEFGRKLALYAGQLERIQAELDKANGDFRYNSRERIRRFTSDATDLVELRDSVATFGGQMRNFKVSIEGNLRAMLGARAIDLEVSMNLASYDRIIATLRKLIEGQGETVAFSEWAVKEINNKLPSRPQVSVARRIKTGGSR